MVAPMTVGGVAIEPGRCYVIAEAGVNHNGDPALAHSLVDVAADAGADAVKFQTFDPDKVVTRTAAKADYQRETTGSTASQHAMLGPLVLPADCYQDLATHAAARGIGFLSTPFDNGSADFLESLGLAAFKVPSGEITNTPFLNHIAQKHRPVIMSTGMATIDEVADAVHVFTSNGNPLALLHCVSSYPADPHQCNLRAMQAMRDQFGVPVGWSDHTIGTAIGIGAAALGAEIIEKHITLDRSLPGPDHRASIEPPELHALVDGIRAIELALGDGIKRPQPAEENVARVARRSLHTCRAMPAGHVLGTDDVVALRPAGGIPPARVADIVGRRLRVAVPEGQMLQVQHLV